MHSITQQIIDSITKFSKVNFKFSKYMELFLLLKTIPDTITLLLNTDDFIYHLSEANSHLTWLNEFFENNILPTIKKEIRKLKNNPKDVMQEYADFKVDKKPPVFKKPMDLSDRVEQLSFDDLNQKMIDQKGKPISPVRRSKPLSYKGNCPYCGAGNEFLYNNNGKGTQFLCKACSNTFKADYTPKEDIGIYCPYCGYKLSQHHDRKGYIVYKCPNYDCSYYKENNAKIGTPAEADIATSSKGYREHYTYREFKFSLADIRKLEESSAADLNTAKYKAKLSRIKVDQRTLGMIMCFYVNYGLSSRKTALIMRELFGINISHQTVVNYASIVAKIVKPMIDYYPYDLTNTLCGDETYIKVRGKNVYVFFWSDTAKRIITSYHIYKNRDTKAAVQSLYDCFMHYENGRPPEDFTAITDGNPIYNAAQLFYSLCGIKFDLHQVIGVKNKDLESKIYRPNKQREERLNRTYKENYNGTNGYDSLAGANQYMILYVAFYNFLRKHSSLDYKTPVDDHLFDDCELMPDMWIKLIKMSYENYGLQF